MQAVYTKLNDTDRAAIKAYADDLGITMTAAIRMLCRMALKQIAAGGGS